MYQVPPQHTPATVGHLIALVIATVVFMVITLALPVEHVGGDPNPQPPHAPAGLDL